MEENIKDLFDLFESENDDYQESELDYEAYDDFIEKLRQES